MVITLNFGFDIWGAKASRRLLELVSSRSRYLTFTSSPANHLRLTGSLLTVEPKVRKDDIILVMILLQYLRDHHGGLTVEFLSGIFRTEAR